MLKSKQQALHISIFAAIVMLVSACGGNIIKPMPKGYVGHSTVRNITVVNAGSVTSTTIADRVKKAVRKKANNELSGNMKIDLKITLDKWQGTETTVGGSVTNTLLGSKNYLNGIVDVLDAKTGALIGKYKIYSEHKEGGLLSAKTTTISFTNVDETVINNFAMYTVYHLE
ncbi:MAG: hypothetical protein OEY78_10000 [Gammaproteobacteria bacterium]|nr:hypothetical protein [Gammaproteobacteria bacterium]